MIIIIELVGAYKKRFMPQNGQVAVLQCSPIWKKMRKSFKTLSEFGNGKLWLTRPPIKVVH